MKKPDEFETEKAKRQFEKKITVRLSEIDSLAITAKAAFYHCSESDIVRKVIKDYLLKDVNDTSIVTRTLPNILKGIKQQQESIETFMELYIYMMKYTFLFAPDYPNDNDVQEKKLNIANKSKQLVLEAFKKYKMVNRNSWLAQQILAGFKYTDDATAVKTDEQ